MKKIFLSMLFFLSFFSIFPDEQKNDLSEKSEKLLKEKKLVISEMHELRTELISENSELKKIRDKILELHRKLAEKLAENEEMKILSEKIIEIDERLQEISESEEDDKENSN